MTRHVREEDFRAIEEIVRQHPQGITAQRINDALEFAPPRRTLQYRLKSLVDNKRLIMEGTGRWSRYRMPQRISSEIQIAASAGHPSVKANIQQPAPPLSASGTEIQEYVRQPVPARTPVGYNHAFLDSYRPNETFYLSREERALLREAGSFNIPEQTAGTYARKTLEKLLIDLSWNSSRLEGNTYSLLDTQRLIEAGEQAPGKELAEAQMILNHKDAIEFLVESAEEIGFNRYTLLNLHALLANGLLPTPEAEGRLRHMDVGIEGSVFYPLGIPQSIEEYFDRILTTASAITDPFEQALFVLVQLPYLQPFDDLNKRVSRLSANIPLIRANLSPLSFEDVPRDIYTEALLGVYEQNRIELFRDVFVWAYKRSAVRYAAARQSLQEPDPIRIRHRVKLREVVSTIVCKGMGKMQASLYIDGWTKEHIEEEERERFRKIAEREVLSLHEGSFARYRIRPSEFTAWQEVWNKGRSPDSI